MRDINQVVLTGRLTRDPELRSTPSGMQVLSIGLAVNDSRKNAQTGEWEDVPNFVDGVIFGAPAEWLSRDLRKGTAVAGSGRLRFSSWEKDGQRRSKVEVVFNDIRRLAGRGDGAAATQEGKDRQPVDDGLYDADVPF